MVRVVPKLRALFCSCRCCWQNLTFTSSSFYSYDAGKINCAKSVTYETIVTWLPTVICKSQSLVHNVWMPTAITTSNAIWSKGQRVSSSYIHEFLLVCDLGSCNWMPSIPESQTSTQECKRCRHRVIASALSLLHRHTPQHKKHPCLNSQHQASKTSPAWGRLLLVCAQQCTGHRRPM